MELSRGNLQRIQSLRLWINLGVVFLFGIIFFAEGLQSGSIVPAPSKPSTKQALSPLQDVALPPGLPALPPTTGDTIRGDVNNEIATLTSNLTHSLQKHFSFCVTSRERERDEVFGFHQSNSTFLTDCDDVTGGTLAHRVCVSSEISLYFTNLATVDTPPPNINCNATSWPQACEAGWAGRASGNITLQSDFVPTRNLDPLPCCAGFFCPRGLSCMISCPLGAYCPIATLNHITNICDPYGYQVTGNSSIYSCGGADKWSDVSSTINIFCPAGQYCPTPVEANNCSVGHYCRLGSTYQEKCSHLTSCNSENLQHQNLQGVGGLLLALLSIMLLVVYTCSDWLMEVRHRRKALAREAAAKQAHERISGVERLKQVKETAKRHASKLSRKLSRSMGRRTPATLSNDEELQRLSLNSELNSKLVPHSGIITETINENEPTISPRPGLPQLLASLSGELSNLVPHPDIITGTINENEPTISPRPGLPRLLANLSGEFHTAVDPESFSGIQEEVPNPPDPISPVTNLNDSWSLPPILIPTRESDSQLFAYAYGQIEKERAFGFKGQSPSVKDPALAEQYDKMVIGKKRFKIELSFKDLSLILKGSGKMILSSVTGKLSPGRITAVMGPSGAGKTTFLNAIAGKITNSHTKGQVLINGKPGSIHSYKRIIGFVPQDDIVHGSLTVEENLQFSASYRLPVNMPKYERVLVVERIIQALGLEPIRDSLVGTVEKRGISGGQRKRVNVGLELVMEPSLLILDEPTSGLDSTSSRLVLQALRREAKVGVNVSLVLHQPSYGLFKMFDDVMFLAKGGHMVYLGPVSEVESYFLGLGLEVPERINPPDYYMDALEGLVKQQNSPNFDPRSLPVLWMMHKGYKIPTELLAVAAETDISIKERKSILSESSKLATTFVQELRQDLYHNFVVTWDGIKTTFSKVDDLSGRQTPGFLLQFRIIFLRVGKQRFREARQYVQDYIILLMAGACLGVLSNMKDTSLGSQGYSFTLIALALLSMISSLRTFSADKLQYWRESASGINRIAFFIAKDVAGLFNVALKPLIYLSMFYFFSNPRSTFFANYIITLVLVYCVTGISYIIAILLEPAPAQLCSVFLPVIATLIVSSRRTGFVHGLTYLSYARYALEAYVISNAERYRGVWIIARCGLLASQGYHLQDWGICILILFLHGVVARVVALLCLCFSYRNRQK